MKKKNKGQLCIILGMICSLLFMLPLYITLFGGPMDQEWLTLAIAPGFLGCGLIICGNYIQDLEHQLATITQKK
jgi:hypothetical protein